MSEFLSITYPAQWGGTLTPEQTARLRQQQAEHAERIGQLVKDDEWQITGQSSAALPMLGDLGQYHVLYVTVSLVKHPNIVTFTSATKSERFDLDAMTPVVETVESAVNPVDLQTGDVTPKRTRRAAK
jgi:hypothetical protein